MWTGSGKGMVLGRKGGFLKNQEKIIDMGMKMPFGWLTKSSHGWGIGSY